MLMLVCLLTIVSPFSSAAPKLMVYDVQVAADPAVQGPDLPITVRANAGCGGACCYVVYGQELRSEILLPANFTLLPEGGARSQWLTSSGQAQGTVAAQPGGGLTWVQTTWLVNGSSYGTFELAVRVTGSNDAGDRINYTSYVNVTIASGAAISSPMFPHRPVVGRETTILVNVSSRKGVNSVSLFIGSDNRTMTKVQMSLLEGNLYSAKVPASREEKDLVFYMESVDRANESFRTGEYFIKIRDPAKITSISQGATIAVTAGSLGGMVLILYLGSRRLSVFRSKGLFMVGDSKMEAALRERDEMRTAQGRMIALRWRIIAAAAVVTLVLFTAALLTGQIDRVIRHTTNPTEAFIWVRLAM